MRCVAFFVILAACAFAPAAATAPPGSAIVKWRGQSIVKLTLTPNYASGFGAIQATFGTPGTPQHGSDAYTGGGAVDFGPVLAGDDYLYRYANHLNVFTNASAGFNLYAEGAADFTNAANPADTQPLDQTLYYLASVDGTSQIDTNTGFSPSLPFYRTAAAANPNPMNPSAPSTITYGSYPAPIASSASATGDFYYDYELRVPPGASNAQYYIWIVYTVVPN